MSILPTPRIAHGTYEFEPGCVGVNISVNEFPEDKFREILDLDPAGEESRSQVLQFRLPNGDLILGFFPQGDTYFEYEADYT